jgi:hypothetical protein
VIFSSMATTSLFFVLLCLPAKCVITKVQVLSFSLLCGTRINNDLVSPTTCSLTRRIFIAPRRGRRKKNIFWQRFSQPSRVSMEMNDINNPLVDKQFYFFQRRKWFCGTGFLLSLNFSAGRDWKKEIKVFQWNRVFDSFYTSKLILFSTFWSLEKKKRKKTGCAVCVIPISHEGWKSSCSSAAPRF